MIASSVSKGDYKTAKEVTGLALKVQFYVCVWVSILSTFHLVMRSLGARYDISQILVLYKFMCTVQIGLLTGIILFAILGSSFGSLATLFTKDADVLGIVRTGVLVSYTILWWWILLICVAVTNCESSYSMLSWNFYSSLVPLNLWILWHLFLMVCIMVFQTSHMQLAQW